MAEEKPTLFRLTRTLDNARRYLAAGNNAKARGCLRTFQAHAHEILGEQQAAMVKDMNHHLKLRRQLTDLVSEAKEVAKEVPGETSH